MALLLVQLKANFRDVILRGSQDGSQAVSAWTEHRFRKRAGGGADRCLPCATASCDGVRLASDIFSVDCEW